MPMRPLSKILVACALFLLVGSAANASAANPWRKSHPWNIAHQGGEGEFPGNTLFALKKSLRAGADMLELDIGVTKDNRVVIQHNTTVDARTNGTGEVRSFTLRQIQQLDNAYWYSATSGGVSYSHEAPLDSYKYRGIATGQKKPPKGYKPSDFRVASLRQVLRAFPHTPINLEIKGRTPAEDVSEYLQNARVLARELKRVKRRDIIVVSFKQDAVDEFHRLAPKIPIAPGVEGMASFLLFDVPPSKGTIALQPPVTYQYPGLGLVEVSTSEWIAKAHAADYAWQNWFSDDDSDSPTDWAKMVDRCSDGIMSAYPVALEAFLKANPSPDACKQRP